MEQKTHLLYKKLYEAITHENNNLVVNFLKNGASCDNSFYPYLTESVIKNNFHLTTIVLTIGKANPNAQTSLGKSTPLHAITRRLTKKTTCYHTLLKLLLNFGSDPNIEDSLQTTPFEQAILSQNTDAIKIILDHQGSNRVAPALIEKVLAQLISKKDNHSNFPLVKLLEQALNRSGKSFLLPSSRDNVVRIPSTSISKKYVNCKKKFPCINH